MKHRRLGRTNFEVSEIGYGAWGIGGTMWIGASDKESLAALRRAIELGVNFIDTALVYGDGHSEELVGAWPVKRAQGLCRHQSSAEEPHVARALRHRHRRSFSPRLHRSLGGREPEKSASRDRSTCCSFTSGIRSGPVATNGAAPSKI